MPRPEYRLERTGARLRPWVLFVFMAAVFLAVSGGRLPVEPLELSAHDNSAPVHTPTAPHPTGCPDTAGRVPARLPGLLTRL